MNASNIQTDKIQSKEKNGMKTKKINMPRTSEKRKRANKLTSIHVHAFTLMCPRKITKKEPINYKA